MSESKPESYDLCIIGAGPAGFAGAMRAFDAGKKVCIIEKGDIGGTGVKWGALASKTMWELSLDYAIASMVDRGYRASGLVVNYADVRKTVMQAVKEKQHQMLSQIETFSPRRWQGPGSLTLKKGTARFISKNEVSIQYPDGPKETVLAKFFLIATGSAPRPMPNIDIDQKSIIDSDGILNLEKFPQRLMIIGGGIIGCEYATIFSNFGQTKVFLIDYMDRILPYEDPDISQYVASHLKNKGVEIIHSCQLKQIVKGKDNLDAVLDFTDGRSEVMDVDVVMISIGRTPNISNLAIENIGVFPDPSGFLKADKNCRVIDNIYAAGDVLKHPALVNIAEMESRYAVKHMFNFTRFPLNYKNLSTVMFFHPVVAAVGLNEKNCQEKKIPYRVGYYSTSLLSRALAKRAMDGFVKIIVTDDKEQKILGMRAAGPQASNTIMSITMLMDQDKGINDALKSIYPHPTMSEAILECLRLLLDKSIYKAKAFPQHLKIRRWHPDHGYLD